MLVNEHEFSNDRVDKVIKTLTDSKQKTLGSWFK
jgi:hypothetical protein